MKVYGFTINYKCAIKTNAVTSFVYAHGELEKEIGYDLVWIPEHGVRAKDEGIYDCVFVYPDGETTEAKIFLWKAETFPCIHGLVVKATDTTYLQDAQSKYDCKTEFI